MSNTKTMTECLDKCAELLPEMASKLLIIKEYIEHTEEQLDWLSCLESAGVDNWPGIEYAHQIKQGGW